MEDCEIVALYLRRSEDAIRQTDAAYGRRLHSMAERIVQNFEDAEETVSDTYLKTWNSIPPQKPTHLFAYLARICRHLALDRLDWRNAAKRRAEVVALTEEMEACIPDRSREQIANDDVLGQLMDAFLASLPRESRMIFLRRYWYADSASDIAARYGMKESAVLTRLHRIRKKLQVYLKSEGVSR